MLQKLRSRNTILNQLRNTIQIRIKYVLTVCTDLQGDENAKQKFIEVSEAYEVLKDDEKRARYDQFGEMGVNDNGAGYGQANVDMDELLRHFADIFGGEARSYGGFGWFGGFDGFGGYSGEMNNSGSDIAVSISIPFLDGINGCICWYLSVTQVNEICVCQKKLSALCVMAAVRDLIIRNSSVLNVKERE